MRVNITMECTECHERNYLTSKNRRNNPDRLELKKYCPRERKVTLHRETKQWDSSERAGIFPALSLFKVMLLEPF